MNDPRPAPLIPMPRREAERPLRERDDEALMLLAAAEHRPAFEAIVDRYLSRLTNYCTKFVGSARTGEELAQETLLEVWARRRLYRSQRGFPVFVFTVARNRCLNEVRRDARRRRWDADVTPPEAPEAAAGDAPDPLDRLVEQERVRRVRAALLELPPKLREAVLLRFDQGLEYAEIASIVGRPESTVRSRVFLAMRTVRRAVAGEGEP